MFIIKKLISQAFNPLLVILTLLLVSAWLLLFTKKVRLGKTLLVLALLALAAASFNFVPNRLTSMIETRHEAYDFTKNGRVPFVVVLGGGSKYDPAQPVTSRLEPCALARLIEGVRIHFLNPGSALVLSGGSVFGSPAEADLMAEVAMAIGVDPERMILERESVDTISEVREIKKIVGDNTVALVTSATHMPRSMGMFRKAGMKPVAAPTDFLTSPGAPTTLNDFFPSGRSITKLERSLHEYIGMIWAWCKGQM